MEIKTNEPRCDVHPVVYVSFRTTKENLHEWFQWLIRELGKEDGVWGPRGGNSGLGNFTGYFWGEYEDRIKAKLAELGISGGNIPSEYGKNE